MFYSAYTDSLWLICFTSGDAAASYLVSTMANQTANQRLGAVAGHLLQAKITIAPGSKVAIEVINDDGSEQPSSKSSTEKPQASSAPPAYDQQDSGKKEGKEGIDTKEGDKMVAG